MDNAAPRGKVLIIDDDRDVVELVRAVLTDEAFSVSVLHDQSPNAIRVAIGQLEPDCVLLDGKSPMGYGESWLDAAWMTARERQVGVIMFTAQLSAAQEAEAAGSERARAANFASIVSKPFDLDDLVDRVTECIGTSTPFDTSTAAERARSESLVARLDAVGATDIHASTRREWANFRTPNGTFIQL